MITDADRAAAHAAFASLDEAERARVWAMLDAEKRHLLALADWAPTSLTADALAFRAASAVLAARFHNVAVPLGVLIEDTDAECVIWALAEIAAGMLRTVPESAARLALLQCGQFLASRLDESAGTGVEG